MKIKAIVFDFDGMVFHTKEFFSEKYSREYGTPNEQILKFFKNEFRECQRGHLDLKKELEEYLPKWGWTKSIEEFLNYWYEDGELDGAMVELIKLLKEAGVKCVLVTNNDKYRLEHLKDKFKIGELFDTIVASYDTGFFKSEKEMLEKTIEVIGCEPQEVLFCDDKEGHIAVLRGFGFVPFMYKNIEQFKQELIRLGILQ